MPERWILALSLLIEILMNLFDNLVIAAVIVIIVANDDRKTVGLIFIGQRVINSKYLLPRILVRTLAVICDSLHQVQRLAQCFPASVTV